MKVFLKAGVKHYVVDRLASGGVASVADFSGLQSDVEGMRKLLITLLFPETPEDVAHLPILDSQEGAEVPDANKDHGDAVEMLKSEYQKLVESLEKCRGDVVIDTDVLPSSGVVADLLE